MKQKRVFLMCGVPGSGKSTWVRQRIGTYGGYHVSRDEIRFAILSERGGDYFDYENEVIRTFVARINELLDSDEQCVDIYVDATHLTDNSRNQIMISGAVYSRSGGLELYQDRHHDILVAKLLL